MLYEVITLAVADVEAHPVQDMTLAVVRVQIADLEHDSGLHFAEIGLAHRRISTDLVRRAARDDFAIDENRDAVRESEDDAHVVLDHDQGLVLGNAAHLV